MCCLQSLPYPTPILTVTCLDDLWQWLSGTLETHPIWGSRFSFLVTSGTFDGFLLSAGMFHNCQNFDWSGIFAKKKIIKELFKKILLHHIFSPLCPKLLCVRFTVPSFTSLWLADLAKWSPHSSFIVLCLVFCLFGPFPYHTIKAFVSSITEAWYSDSFR